MDHADAAHAGMMHVSWDPRLVALSYLVAVFASLCALDLAGVVSLARRGPGRAAWLFFGAVAMGLGIWSMHFTGMLDLGMGVPVSYDVPLVAASALVAVAASALALFVASRASLTLGTLLAAGPVSWASVSSGCTTPACAPCACPPTRITPHPSSPSP